MGSLEERIRRLERNKPRPDPPEEPITELQIIRELGKLAERLQNHESMVQEMGEDYEEGFDDARYGGETIEEHRARVDRLIAEAEERDKRWRAYVREHRPDLVGTLNEIGAQIAEAEAELKRHWGSE